MKRQLCVIRWGLPLLGFVLLSANSGCNVFGSNEADDIEEFTQRLTEITCSKMSLCGSLEGIDLEDCVDGDSPSSRESKCDDFQSDGAEACLDCFQDAVSRLSCEEWLKAIQSDDNFVAEHCEEPCDKACGDGSNNVGGIEDTLDSGTSRSTQDMVVQNGGFGEACTEFSRCDDPDADYCLKFPGAAEGYCTRTECLWGGCPENYQCCTECIMELPDVCIKDDDVRDLVSGYCTCS